MYSMFFISNVPSAKIYPMHTQIWKHLRHAPNGFFHHFSSLNNHSPYLPNTIPGWKKSYNIPLKKGSNKITMPSTVTRLAISSIGIFFDFKYNFLNSCFTKQILQSFITHHFFEVFFVTDKPCFYVF